MKEYVKFFEAMKEFADKMLEEISEDGSLLKQDVDYGKSSTKKVKAEPETGKEVEEDAQDYGNMSAVDLYKLCCERSISSKVKSRKKVDLIAALKAYDNGEIESSKEVAVKAKKADVSDDDWEDDEEQEEEKDIYEGKKAKELYNMCQERGIKCKQKMKPEEYVKLLKRADEESEEDEDDEDDDWEI